MFTLSWIAFAHARKRPCYPRETKLIIIIIIIIISLLYHYTTTPLPPQIPKKKLSKYINNDVRYDLLQP